jgi:hypothetical protein
MVDVSGLKGILKAGENFMIINKGTSPAKVGYFRGDLGRVI